MTTKGRALIPQAFIEHVPMYLTGETNMKQTQTLLLKKEVRKTDERLGGKGKCLMFMGILWFTRQSVKDFMMDLHNSSLRYVLISLTYV